MAVRQKDEQAGKRVNPGKARTRWRAFAGLLLAATCALTGAAPAAADEPATPSLQTTASAAAPAADRQTDASQDILTIAAVTPVVSATSGWHLTVTVTNTSGHTWQPGRLTAFTSPGFTFRSRSDIQHWAEGGTGITTRTELGSVSVPELQPDQSATVTIDAGDDVLARFVTWGPKPVRVEYAATEHTGAGGTGSQAVTAQLRSFLTRSTDGLNTLTTPPLKLTVALPLTGGSWSADTDATSTLLTQGTDAAGQAGQTNQSGQTGQTGQSGQTNAGNQSGQTVAADTDYVTPDQNAADQRGRAVQQLVTDHPKLQVLADPAYLKELSMPVKAAAITQPADFDVTAYAATANPGAYDAAGVGTAAWTADAALADYRTAMGSADASVPTVAMQGQAAWTMSALTTARQQGYDTVIASSDYEDTQPDTVHNANSEVSTSAGVVTVLVEQRELSTLARGHATTTRALGERTEAGRIARFMAQSAFYQMEQPYVTRNLLTCLNSTADDRQADALMDAIESAPWLELTGLTALTRADSYESGEAALSTVPQDADFTQAEANAVNGTLNMLGSARGQITRFGSTILDSSSSASRWINQLLTIHDELALHALGSDASQRAQATSQAQAFADRVLGSVEITPTEAVTVVSETAKMPVTVSNHTPYPVSITVSSKTDSMEIVTSRTNALTIPASGEAQTAFTIRVSTSGSTTATLSLLDRTGKPFGAQQTTAITSVLRISDKTGFVIIGLAVVMAALGLWRQFNRKKDPDE